MSSCPKKENTPSLPPPGLVRNAAEAQCGSCSSTPFAFILFQVFLTPPPPKALCWASWILSPLFPWESQPNEMERACGISTSCLSHVIFLAEIWELFRIQVLWFSIFSSKLQFFKKSRTPFFVEKKKKKPKKWNQTHQEILIPSISVESIMANFSNKLPATICKAAIKQDFSWDL